MHPAALDDLPATPDAHFRLYFYAALIELIREAATRAGSFESLLERHGFIAIYLNELAERGLEGGTLEEAGGWWREGVERWERRAASKLPLRDLACATGVDYEALVLLVGAGVSEEDGRLARLFEGESHSAGRPSAGLMMGWFAGLGAGAVRARIRRLVELGLLRVSNADAPFPSWIVEVRALLWDALRGEAMELRAPWLRMRALSEALPLSSLCIPADTREQAERVAALLAERQLDGVVVRGPRHNGRRTLLGAIARASGKALLEVDARNPAESPDLQAVGPLAVLLDAMPVFVFDPGPGEVVALPRLSCAGVPFGVVLGSRGGLSGAEGRRVVTFELPIPDREARRELWSRALGDLSLVPCLSEAFRMTTGNLAHVCRLARAHARVGGRAEISLIDVRDASRVLDRSGLDALATRLNVSGGWDQLALSPEARRELEALETRCRHRERLCGAIGIAHGSRANCGVRALLRGPSGTGKTLAAHVLASALDKDLYRIDLSTVVNKYIGETEKNLDRALSRAEELDVILLFDEGDALLGQRTSVRNANDRYANLETNFLLQRLETFEGVLLISTNLDQEVDSAFRRRIDVVVDFRLPDREGRLAILQLHLPREHEVCGRLLEEIADRCTMSGGQIRNAVLHACLQSMAEGAALQDRHLEAAVQREYRKIGAVCPLRGPTRLSVAAS